MSEAEHHRGTISVNYGPKSLNCFRNRLFRIEQLARTTNLACSSENAPTFMDCIEASLDSLISELMDVVDDMSKIIGDDPRDVGS